MRPLLDLSHVTITAPGGRPLFDALNLRLAREHVALVGRNGVGKSTLLRVLSGDLDVQEGERKTAGRCLLVPQALGAVDHGAPRLSHGQRRRLALTGARSSGAEILLLDEPSEDLDEPSVSWLRAWLRAWPGCLVVASHDRRLLGDFRDFFIASESGCRSFEGTLAELDAELERDHDASQDRYVRALHRLGAYEEHAAHVARRKARKKRYGRCSEIDRGTPRIRLNQKRSDAQVSQGRVAKVREARLDSLREWSKSARRALGVSMPIELSAPVLSGPERDLVVLEGVSASATGRQLFSSVDRRIGRQRLGVVGPNGAGKTTLLQIMLGRRPPTSGTASRDSAAIGSIAQGGADWMLEESLLAYLRIQGPGASSRDPADALVAHKFPLALAERPLRSLSPGERARAALLCLFLRSPPVELLVLDEPTYSLDLVGQRAIASALRAWPGGLVVASHDRDFLSAIGADTLLDLGA